MDPNDDQKNSKKYLELRPRRTNILRIFRVLSSDDYTEECKDFIESAEETKEEVAVYRGVVFVSILAQKLLQYIEKPLSLLGSILELCLNIFCNTSNFQIFFNNLFRGKVVVPSERSASFVSINGHLDKRVDLDKNIKPGRTNKYFASLSAMASKLAYENHKFIQITVQNTWKMELLGSFSFWDDRYGGDATQAFLFLDNKTKYSDTIIVAFRGTEPFNANDWSSDCDISFCKLQGIKGKLHQGFVKALGLLHDGNPIIEEGVAYTTITHVLSCHFKSNTATRLIVTGHSLGGALAVLLPAALVMHGEIPLLERLEAVYTFGQPRVGDAEFGKFMEEKFKLYGVEYCRFVYNNDIVPRLPFDNQALMFKHFGKCIYVNSLYEAKIVEEEPLKNYFDCGSVATKRVDAMWEMVRSFFLPRMFGPDYEEGLLQLMFRMSGLVFPGLPDHGLQDYINSTRLATY
ncbi:hypothetical protein C2S52_012299 [Perilla frutescens var. hirtella]|nr:hypothetical protein C2S52_012299 [Perilla frutescens var. hirtella]